MRSLLSIGSLAIFTLALALPVGAGDKKKEGGVPGVKRGPEHKVLQGLVGVYDAKVKMFIDPKAKPTESKGVMTRKMILGGNYLQESYQGEFFGSAFTGMGVIGYDQNKKQYVTSWVDSMSTSIMLMHGAYDSEKKTLIMMGEDIEPNSTKKMKTRDVLTIINADTQKLEMFRLPEGVPAEFKVMEITFTRRKAEAEKDGK